MKAHELESELVNWSVRHSGHEQRRPYIGLSAIGDCPAAVYDSFTQGQTQNVGEHLKTRLAYELEYALVVRLREMGLYQAAQPISLHGGLVQGHLDGLILHGGQTDILEIKTVPLAEHIPDREAQVPRRIYWQVQAYLHYAQRRLKLDVSSALVVYLARENGLVSVKQVMYSLGTGVQIDGRVRNLVAAVQERFRPACVCGNHLPEGSQGTAP